jgi:hypothetical protein
MPSIDTVTVSVTTGVGVVPVAVTVEAFFDEQAAANRRMSRRIFFIRMVF